MQAITPEGEKSSLTSDESIEQAIDSLVDAIDAPKSALSPFIELVEGMAHQLDETAQEAAQARERAHEAEARVEELEADLKEEREARAKESAEDRQRIHRVEERLDSVEEGGSSDSNDKTPTPQGQETPSHEPDTPLEEIVQLPEHLAEENLSANQQRARFAAKGIHEYSRSVPAGRVIKSSELRRVLSAGEEDRVYTQTVSRVIDFLTELGKDDVNLRETQTGERVVVFSDEIVKRIVAYHNRSNGVVTEGGATG